MPIHPTPVRLLVLLAAAGLSACVDAVAPGAPPEPTVTLSLAADDAAIDGRFLVRFSGGVPAGFAERVAALGGSVLFAHDGAGLGGVEGLSAEAAAELEALAGVGAVMPDVASTLDTRGAEPEYESAGAGLYAAADPTTATMYPRQWHLRAIGAPEAWAAGRLGSPAVRVAILDSGLDYTHPDLVGRVDLERSRSFIPSEDARVAGIFPGAHPIADLNSHGTHVGATVSSNAVLGAGVTSRVTLVGIKTCGLTGGCPMSAAVQGLLYAADLGVDVANLSHGSEFQRRDGAGAVGPAYLAVLQQAFTYAHRKGVTVVVAAGNSSVDLDHDGNQYKAYCGTPTVICVAATGPVWAGGFNGPFEQVDAVASYTNFGRSAISVAAPGGGLALPSTRVSAACSRFSLLYSGCRRFNLTVLLGGTSMSAAVVSGAAALVAEDVGRDPARVRARLEQTADDLGQPGRDPYYGRGRIHVGRALGLR